MENIIRIIALDLDGTAFNDKKEITPKTQEAIATAIQHGIIVMPATGRPTAGIPQEFTQIPGVRYAVVCNGSQVVDLYENQVVYETAIPREIVLKLMDLLNGIGGTFELYMNGTAYISQHDMDHLEEYVPTPNLHPYMRKTRVVVDDIEQFYKTCPHSVVKINMSYPNMEMKQKVFAMLEPYLTEVDCVSGQPTNLELTRKGTNKGDALLKFGESMGIAREQIMAFGDSSNDREMLKKVGIGVAMANADDETKSCADFVTGHNNNEDGIAEVIEEILALPAPTSITIDCSEIADISELGQAFLSACSATAPDSKKSPDTLEEIAAVLNKINTHTEFILSNFECLAACSQTLQLTDMLVAATKQNEHLTISIEEKIQD